MTTSPARFCDCDEPNRELCLLRAPLGMVVRGARHPVECRLFHIEGAIKGGDE